MKSGFRNCSSKVEFRTLTNRTQGAPRFEPGIGSGMLGLLAAFAEAALSWTYWNCRKRFCLTFPIRGKQSCAARMNQGLCRLRWVTRVGWSIYASSWKTHCPQLQRLFSCLLSRPYAWIKGHVSTILVSWPFKLESSGSCVGRPMTLLSWTIS